MHDRYLYPSELRSIVPEGTSKEDSARLCQDFIDNWIKHQLLLQVASLNLSGKLPEIDQQAREYRESLLIEAYLRDWTQQNLDTALSLEEIEVFYSENREQFLLQDAVYRVDFVIGEVGKIKPDSVRFWFRNLSRHQSALDAFCSRSCIDYSVDVARWYSMDDLRRNFQLSDFPQDKLEAREWIEIQDRDRLLMFQMREQRRKGEYAPMEYSRTDIYKRILNRRQRDLIKSTYRDLYIEGSKRNQFEIFEP